MARPLITPAGYRPLLDITQTESAIKKIKNFFEQNLATELRLRRVTAPLFVKRGMGINDDLNGIERPVSFAVKATGDTAEIVQSLAKWKRMALADYGIPAGFGLYTDMNAIRPDEELDNIHSLYVDQWDWELAITAEERSEAKLKNIVERIYGVIRRTEYFVHDLYPQIAPILPERIRIVHAEELRAQYPDLPPVEREDRAAKEHGAIFVVGIGAPLSDGKAHDGRAPDYDDWTTVTAPGRYGLNGDIVVWNPVLDRAFELSSMGIRVDRDALLRQLEMSGTLARRELWWHKRLLAGELPLSLGGGIGQSRLCMFYLRKAHIGEVQAGIWPAEMAAQCREKGVPLL